MGLKRIQHYSYAPEYIWICKLGFLIIFAALKFLQNLVAFKGDFRLKWFVVQFYIKFQRHLKTMLTGFQKFGWHFFCFQSVQVLLQDSMWAQTVRELSNINIDHNKLVINILPWIVGMQIFFFKSYAFCKFCSWKAENEILSTWHNDTVNAD